MVSTLWPPRARAWIGTVRTNGKIFEKECRPQRILIVKSEDKKPDYMGKPQFYPAVLDIDISVCMSCQICVDVCPFEAIKMDKLFELSTRERFDALLQRKGELSKSNTYYHSIHPIEAAEVDAKLAEAAEAAAKRRSLR
jgi:NADH-quinone oxidoreductase subunit I